MATNCDLVKALWFTNVLETEPTPLFDDTLKTLYYLDPTLSNLKCLVTIYANTERNVIAPVLADTTRTGETTAWNEYTTQRQSITHPDVSTERIGVTLAISGDTTRNVVTTYRVNNDRNIFTTYRIGNDRNICTRYFVNNDRYVTFETSKSTDKQLLTKAWDRFTVDRIGITESRYFENTKRWIVQNFYPVTVKEYRYVYQKSPHEYTTFRYFTFGLKIPPNDIKKIITRVCPKAISDRNIVHGIPYIPYRDRYVTLLTERHPILRILKSPKYFRWRYLPHNIDSFKFSIKESILPIDWKTLTILIDINNTQETIVLNMNNSNITINQIADKIYNVEVEANVILPENSNVKILVYLLDVNGNYISDVMW